MHARTRAPFAATTMSSTSCKALWHILLITCALWRSSTCAVKPLLADMLRQHGHARGACGKTYLALASGDGGKPGPTGQIAIAQHTIAVCALLRQQRKRPQRLVMLLGPDGSSMRMHQRDVATNCTSWQQYNCQGQGAPRFLSGPLRALTKLLPLWACRHAARAPPAPFI